MYMTHSYTTLVTLSMHRKSADQLKLTWYKVRLKKMWSTKIPGGGGRGFRLSAHGLLPRDVLCFHHMTTDARKDL